MALSEETRQFITSLIERNAVVVFMKGDRSFPQCGFSARVVQMLDGLLDDYKTVDVASVPFPGGARVEKMDLLATREGGPHVRRRDVETGFDALALLDARDEAREFVLEVVRPAHVGKRVGRFVAARRASAHVVALEESDLGARIGEQDLSHRGLFADLQSRHLEFLGLHIMPSWRRAAYDIMLGFHWGWKTTSMSTSAMFGSLWILRWRSVLSTSPMPQPGAVRVNFTSTRLPPSGRGWAAQR